MSGAEESDVVTGQADLGATVAAFDRAVERYLDRWRGQPWIDELFTAASRAGDFSLVWHVSNIVRGARSGRLDEAVVVGVALGAESLIVNQGVKRLFRRQRPTETGDPSTPVRRPQTSSFPSGHATAAAFHTVVMIALDRQRGRRRGHWRRAVWWWLLALVVATSRVHVRIHHPSDVLAGLVLGTVLGSIAARIIRRILR